MKTLLKEKNIDYNNETSSKIKHLKNKVESKDNTNQIKNNLKISISPEMNFQTTNAKLFKNELESNNNKETKYMSTTPNIPPKKKEEMELQVSINSLNKVDINSVINSLNFDFENQQKTKKKLIILIKKKKQKMLIQTHLIFLFLLLILSIMLRKQILIT